jgi:dihydroorotate dehydrogenase
VGYPILKRSSGIMACMPRARRASTLDATYRRVLLPPVRILTRRDAETAHEWFLTVMRGLERRPGLLRSLAGRWRPHAMLRQTLLDGLDFATPFGVAAGLDKNAAIYRALQAVSSPGFIEIGTVTPRAQAGNPRPRVVRVDASNIINAMGFPNEGVEAAIGRLATAPPQHAPLGLNIGKMRDTSEADTPEEYRKLIAATAELHTQHRLPDFYVINVSSPNTPGLTSMQKVEPLSAIVEATTTELDAIGQHTNLRHRLLIKLGPDIDAADLEPVVDLVDRFDIGGLIATNTTTTRPVRSRHDDRAGGFSGSALYDRSARTVRFIASRLPRNRVLVATGGIDTADRAFEMLRHADLIGGYTGLVLQGPRLFRRLADGVADRMRHLGVGSLAELREETRPA